MPEREFELYLALLARFLRLDAAQREQIADELRDHFEERFEDLLASGLSREEAIQATLEEFGDAAGLAAHFSHIGNRRRRTIMRCTIGSGVGLVAAAILLMSFWTEAPPVIPGPARAVAQQPAAPAGAAGSMGTPVKKPEVSAVDAKLDGKRVPELEFVETPLKDVLEFLGDATEIDILLNKRALNELEIADDVPVTLHVTRTPVTARTALELVLEQVSSDLGYTVRDGIIYVTQKYDNDEIQVYNVRDLLQGSTISPAAPQMAGEGGMPGGMPGMMMGAGGEGMGGLGGGVAAPATVGEALARVIESTVFPETWSSAGGSGSLAEFNGLLVVKQSQTVHREIKQLLEMMRQVGQQNTAAP